MISLKALLLLVPYILAADARALEARRAASNEIRIETVAAQAFAAPAPNVVTDNYAAIVRSANTPRGHSWLHKYRAQEAARNQKRDDSGKPSKGGDAPLIQQNGVEYLMHINFQGSDEIVIVDTGSSDTWLVEKDFQCTDSIGSKVAQSQCRFGAPYPGKFKGKSLGQLQIGYGDGEQATGNFGLANITLAGITVPNVEAALVNNAYWNGDGVSSGLLGLALGGLTSDFVNGARVPYNPIFTTMYKDGLSSPSFSMALERGTNGGYVAFGGLPPVKYDDNSWAATPIKKSSIYANEAPQYGFYAMTPDAIVYKGAPAKQTDDYIVDSGTTLMYTPSDVAAAINGLFTPASIDGQTVACNATAPAVGVKIGGKTFSISPADMILPNGDGTCISGIQGGSAPYILGDVFMKNAVVVFDVGAAELRFAQSQY